MDGVRTREGDRQNYFRGICTCCLLDFITICCIYISLMFFFLVCSSCCCSILIVVSRIIQMPYTNGIPLNFCLASLSNVSNCSHSPFIRTFSMRLVLSDDCCSIDVAYQFRLLLFLFFSTSSSFFFPLWIIDTNNSTMLEEVERIKYPEKKCQ